MLDIPYIKTLHKKYETHGELTEHKLLELIVMSSGLFPVSYAFVRNIKELAEETITALINYDDKSGAAKMYIKEILEK